MTIKANAFFDYRANDVFRNFTWNFCNYLLITCIIVSVFLVSFIKHTFDQVFACKTVHVGYPLSWSVLFLRDALTLNAHRNGKSPKLHLLNNAMHKLLARLVLSSAGGFSLIVLGTHCKCHLSMVICCSDTFENKVFSCMKYRGTKFLRIRSLSGIDDIFVMRKCTRWSEKK